MLLKIWKKYFKNLNFDTLINSISYLSFDINRTFFNTSKLSRLFLITTYFPLSSPYYRLQSPLWYFKITSHYSNDEIFLKRLTHHKSSPPLTSRTPHNRWTPHISAPCCLPSLFLVIYCVCWCLSFINRYFWNGTMGIFLKCKQQMNLFVNKEETKPNTHFVQSSVWTTLDLCTYQHPSLATPVPFSRHA